MFITKTFFLILKYSKILYERELGLKGFFCKIFLKQTLKLIIFNLNNANLEFFLYSKERSFALLSTMISIKLGLNFCSGTPLKIYCLFSFFY